MKILNTLSRIFFAIYRYKGKYFGIRSTYNITYDILASLVAIFTKQKWFPWDRRNVAGLEEKFMLPRVISSQITGRSCIIHQCHREVLSLSYDRFIISRLRAPVHLH